VYDQLGDGVLDLHGPRLVEFQQVVDDVDACVVKVMEEEIRLSVLRLIEWFLAQRLEVLAQRFSDI
jgi:hypothetical protein